MAKLGILTFSDGRPYAHEPQIAELLSFQERLRHQLSQIGHKVVTGNLIHSNTSAREEAERLAREGVEATIFNYAVWAFPQFTVVASRFAPSPWLLFGQINPAKPGMVAVLAASGALDQLGAVYTRIFGAIEDPQILQAVDRWARAAHATKALQGETYGLIGGRSIGINTAVANTDQWAQHFGVDVEHIDQWEIVRRAQAVDQEKTREARRWLEEKVRRIHYDGVQLTPEKLERQIAAYYSLKELIAEKELNFLGIKAQPELTEHFVTMDLPEAFLNDPYDWDGPHDPIVCATEADMDGALTMELLKHLGQMPVLFADVRHYLAEEDLFDLVNSGQHPTFYAARSLEADANLAHVELHPQGFYFPAGGASVVHVAAPGPITLARLSRFRGEYRMHILLAELVRLPHQREEQIVQEVQPNWPHAFAKFPVSAEEFLQNFPTNHIHGIPGDHVEELLHVCRNLNIQPIHFRGA
jgi:L-fucose isomerase